ncbi:MAG: hypothetical protein ACLUYV_05250 [Alistipes shahii]
MASTSSSLLGAPRRLFEAGEQQAGLLPGVSAAWNIHKEKFMEGTQGLAVEPEDPVPDAPRR